MLLRRYGTTVQSVAPDFDPRAMNEIGFRRDQKFSIAVADFESQYERLREESLQAESEGPVQGEAEEELLRLLRGSLDGILTGLGAGEVAFVESEQGVDYPKVRDRKQGIIVEGENRLYFHWRVEPPLRIGIYRLRTG